MIGARRWLLGLGLSLMLGCAAPAAAVRQPPPLDPSAGSTWAYGAYLLSLGDAHAALGYLEPLGGGSLANITNPAILMRDLAEARLAADDLPGAAEAARSARVELARRNRSAQFQADDRRLFERVVDALEAAGDDDLPRLRSLAADESAAPSADAWYLLGWLSERQGDVPGAQAAYRAYLARVPQWAFFRATSVNREHAQKALSP